MASRTESWPRAETAAPAPEAQGVLTRSRPWLGALRGERLALVGVLLLAAVLNIVRLDQQGLGNPYYATAVSSMLQSWHNFFYLSYDPAGFVSVDKPPAGFWLQTLSAWLFGFSGWSLLLPQAIAGVLSVAVLYHLVQRVFGHVAGLLAALALAVTPIAVAVNRNNTVDTTLVLTLLLAAWAIVLATERGSLRWLLLGAALIGLGFNIKMLQAYLIVPAFFFVYLIGAASIDWKRRIVHLAAATLLLLGVSLTWALAVDLTPADQRPYVGSSQDNSVLSLIVGYNGLARLLGGAAIPLIGGGSPMGDVQMPSGAFNPLAMETGSAGPLRLFNDQLAGQIAWLIPLALVGLAAAWQQQPTRWPLSRRHQALLLWGGWFLTAAAFFSVAGMWHRYYLVMLAPPIAALVGSGLAAMWTDYQRPGRRGWLLPLALLGTVAVHAVILADFPEWSSRLTPWIVSLGVAAAGALAVIRWRAERETSVAMLPAIVSAAAAIGLAAILAGPVVWSAVTAAGVGNTMLPAAGPDGGSLGALMPPGAGSAARGPLAAFFSPIPGTADAANDIDPKLLAYLLEHRNGAKYLVSAANTWGANAIILATGEPVAALGGFVGGDPILSNAELAALIGAGEMRFFLIQETEPPAPSGQSGAAAPAAAGPTGMGGPMARALFGDSENVTWIKESCAPVPDNDWRSPGNPTRYPDLDGVILFDCAGAMPAAGDA